MTARTSFRAFTLIELLVVISIIALLVSILLPSLAKARATALAAQCLSSARQLTYACTTYSNDSKLYLPLGAAWDSTISQSRAHRWYAAIGPYIGTSSVPNTLAEMTAPTIAGRNYAWDFNVRGRALSLVSDQGFPVWQMTSFGVGNVFTCPSSTSFTVYTTSHPGPMFAGFDADFTYNGGITGYSQSGGTWFQAPKRDVASPSKAWLLMDGDSYYSQGGYQSYASYASGVCAEQTGSIYTPNTFNNTMRAVRHNLAANLSFVDGHAEAGWQFDRIADHSYGNNQRTRNLWWRGDFNKNLAVEGGSLN